MKAKITNSTLPSTIENLAQAIFTVNRHAKTAPEPKFLYSLKKSAIETLLKEGKATKLGLHFSRNPRNSQQRSDVVVQVGEYLFHIPPTKEDFHQLPHLGELNNHTRNPKSQINLHQSKRLLMNYTGIEEPKSQPNQTRPTGYNNRASYNFSLLGTR